MAFRILFEDWAEVVYAHAYDVLRDEEMAHDVVQRTFLDVYRLTPRLRDGRQFDEWLRRLVSYQCSEVALGRRALSEPAREQDWAHIARMIGIPPEEEEPTRRAPEGAAQEEEWQPILFYPEEDEQQFWYDEDQDPPTVAAAQAVPQRQESRSTDRAAMEAYLKTDDHQPDAPQSAAQPEPLPIRPREKSEPALPEELLARPKEKAKQPRRSRKKAAQDEGERALSPEESAARAANRRRRGDVAVASMLILATVMLAGSGVLLLMMHKGALQTPAFLQEASSVVGGLWEDIVRLVGR